MNGPTPESPPIEAKLAFLRECAGTDERIETHMSWVLLGPQTVLKLRKPVRYPFLDFSTVAAREHDAREELRLNRRLAPRVYLGLLALQWDGARFALVPDERLPAPGRTVDWLVMMQRLPAGRMLDRLLLAGQATPADIDALADVLIPFYRHAPRSIMTEQEHARRRRSELAICRDVLLRTEFGLADAPALLDRLDAALALHEPILRQRVLEGRMVEGHGDLRPEHVCLVDPPVVIDSLEFDPGLRQLDPFEELAFLGLECTMLTARWVGPRLAARCAQALGDAPPEAVLDLYVACRAVLRARLSLAHLLEPDPRTPWKWLPLGRRYLGQARVALDAVAERPRSG